MRRPPGFLNLGLELGFASSNPYQAFYSAIRWRIGIFLERRPGDCRGWAPLPIEQVRGE